MHIYCLMSHSASGSFAITVTKGSYSEDHYTGNEMEADPYIDSGCHPTL